MEPKAKNQRQECILVGYVPSAAVAVYWGGGEWGYLPAKEGGVGLPGGVCRGECLSARGCLPGGSACQGVSAQGVVSDRQPTPRTEFFTHACENITFLQLRLRTVKFCASFPLSLSMNGC